MITRIFRYIYNRNFQNAIMLLWSIVLCFILANGIMNAYTVWELADEAGYLSNAAYFLGRDWNDIRAVMPYYAYGYSVFLVPVYLIADTGVQLIRGAMCANLIFVIGTYFIIIYLLEKVEKQKNRLLTSTISFVTCLNSYLCCSTLKVFCEPLATFWYCLTALILYKTMKKKKCYQFILLGLVSSYLFFIHTRMIVLIAVLFFTTVITLLIYNEKKYLIKMSSFVITFLAFFLLLYFVKQSIVQSAVALSISDITQVNLIDKSYIIDRITKVLMPENLKFYILTFVSKIYYIIVVSVGTLLFGYICFCKKIFCIQSLNVDIQSYAVKMFFLLGMTFMIIICSVNESGDLGNYTTFFYSRYYENTVIPMIAFSLLEFITTKWKHKFFFILIFLEANIGLIVTFLKNYLHNDNIYIDTSRIAGFSGIVKSTYNFENMVLLGTAVTIIATIIFFIFNKFHNFKAFIVLFIALFLTWNSTAVGINLIKEANNNAQLDADIVNYISENSKCDVVYMIDDNSYRYPGYYCRMQVLLKDTPLKVIHEDELEKIKSIQNETWILTYKTNGLKDTYLSDMDYILEGSVFELWRK